MKGKVVIRHKTWSSMDLGNPYIYFSEKEGIWKMSSLKQSHLAGNKARNKPKEIVFEGIVSNTNDHPCTMVLPLAHSQWSEVISKNLFDTTVSVRILSRPNTNFMMAIIENEVESRFHPGEKIRMQKGWGLVKVAEQEKQTHLIKMFEEGVITMVSDDKMSYGIQTKNGYFNWIPEDHIEFKQPWWKR
jgi:hypothetical protein